MLLALAAVYLIWGGSYAVSRIGVHHLPPFLFGGLRFIAAGILLCVASYVLGNRPRLDWRELRHMWWVGMAGVTISNGTNNWSLQWLASNQSALLNATGALWIVILSAFGPRAHALDRNTVAGLLLGFFGTAVVLIAGETAVVPSGGMIHLPEIMTLLGVIGWAVATVYMRSFPSRLDLMTFTGGQMLIGGLLLTAIGLATGEGPRWHWSSAGSISLLYMLFMSSLVGYTAYAWLARHSTPAVVGSYSYVVPAISALLGWWLLAENLTSAQFLGMLVMLAGVALATWPRDAKSLRAAASEGHGA
jgi:drug/metabolite transporter (DMT)-like permease